MDMYVRNNYEIYTIIQCMLSILVVQLNDKTTDKMSQLTFDNNSIKSQLI